MLSYPPLFFALWFLNTLAPGNCKECMAISLHLLCMHHQYAPPTGPASIKSHPQWQILLRVHLLSSHTIQRFSHWHFPSIVLDPSLFYFSFVWLSMAFSCNIGLLPLVTELWKFLVDNSTCALNKSSCVVGIRRMCKWELVILAVLHCASRCSSLWPSAPHHPWQSFL